jgi:hypothetical protein
VSDFIRDAVHDKRLTQRQVVEIEPYKIDNNRLIGAALGGKIEWLIRVMEGKRPEVIKLRVSLFGLFCKFVKSQTKSIWKSASLHFLRLGFVV